MSFNYAKIDSLNVTDINGSSYPPPSVPPNVVATILTPDISNNVTLTAPALQGGVIIIDCSAIAPGDTANIQIPIGSDLQTAFGDTIVGTSHEIQFFQIPNMEGSSQINIATLDGSVTCIANPNGYNGNIINSINMIFIYTGSGTYNLIY